MNLTVHIVRKDFERVRWFAWAALLLHGVLPLLMNWPGRSVALPMLQIFCLLVHFGVVTCGTVLLVHEDPVAGPRGRWITMPISGTRLFAAKLTSIALFFWLLPNVVQVFVSLIVSGAPLSLALGLGNVLITMAVTTTALLIASLTNDLSRFLLWMMLAALAWQFVFWPGVRGWFVAPAAFDTKLVWVVVVLGVLGLLGFLALVALNQFRTRRSARSIALLLFGLAGLVLGAYATRTFIASTRPPPRPGAEMRHNVR